MPRPTSLVPTEPVPDLELDTVDGAGFDLADAEPDAFTMVVFYRGHHCPVCAKYLRELDRRLDEFRERGVVVIAASSDDASRARASVDDWRLEALRVGYDLDLEHARRWGLYVSEGIGTTSSGVEEPALFNEPAVYLVRPDGTLYFGSVQTMPFARPDFDQLLRAIDYANAKDYPARGEHVGRATVEPRAAA